MTDVEGSTSLWERDPVVMGTALERHDELLAVAVAENGGHVVKERGEGDSIFAVFADPGGAIRAAVDAQLAIDREPWPTDLPLRVRMAVHTGPAGTREDDWYGPAVNRCGRIRAAAHGGQVLTSSSTVKLVEGRLPRGVAVRSLGRHWLRDLPHPEEIFQVCHDRLRDEFPPIRTLDAAPHDLPVARMPRAKVTPPALSPTALLQRPTLTEGVLSHRLTTILAGPGFGKSTTLGAWCATVPAAWYALDPADLSPTRMVAGLVEALNVALPGFAADFGSVPAGADADSEQVETLATTLSTALDDALDEDLALVLDDFQALPAGSASVSLIEALVRLAPARLHLVVASREEVPFPVERLRGQGQVMSFEAADLAFDEGDVARMVRELLGEEDRELAAVVTRLTAGWPAAARLAVEALRGRAPADREAMLGKLGAPDSPLYGYLAEEVLDLQPAATRALLERMAPIGSFTVELCEVLGVPDAADTLALLTSRGVFLEPGTGADGWFSLHALIREVAASRGPDEGELRDLQRAAGAWFEERGHADRALESYSAAGESAAVRRIIAARGHDLVASGHAPAVVKIARSLPPQAADPAVDEAMGELLAAAGDTAGAKASISRAASGVDPLPSGLAFRYAMAVHYTEGAVGAALRVWDRARPAHPATHEDAMLLAFTANAEVQLGHQDRADQTATAALETALPLPSRTPEAEARIALGMVAAAGGDHRAAQDQYGRGLEAAEASDNMIAVCRARVFLARSLVDRGLFAEATAELDVVLPLTERIGWWLFRAWGLCERARVACRTGDLDAAHAACTRAETILRARSSDFACRPLYLLGEVHRLRGEPARALDAYGEARRLAERSGVVADVADVLVGLALVTAGSDHAEARRLAQDARACAPERRATCELALGWIALTSGATEDAVDHAVAAGVAATRRDERPLALEAMELGGLAERDMERGREALETVAEGWRGVGDVLAETRARLAAARLHGLSGEPAAQRAERRLRSLGVTIQGLERIAGPLMVVLAGERPPVSVETLGPFAVRVNGVPVGLDGWRKSRKARDLLKLLVARRGRPATREHLMDVLWPGEPADRLGNRFSVALAAVRHALDPDRLFPTDHFIRGDAAAIALDLSALPVDVEQFLALAESGLALRRTGPDADAAELLELAAERYTGDFLEEDPYEDWADPLRDEARSAYLTVLRTLYEIAAETGDTERAARHLHRLLESDPHDEQAHLGLVRLLAATGRHGEARRRYLAYARRMGEIGVEPLDFDRMVAGVRSAAVGAV